MPLTPDQWIVAGTVVVALALFISEKLSIDLVALMIAAVLVATGVISPAEGLSGFSDPATLTVAFMFVLSAAIVRSGALATLGPRLSERFRQNKVSGLLVLMALAGGISPFVNNTPIVAVFIPVAVQMARSANMHPGQLLIPLSFATIFGGTVTLIGTSTNIVVSGLSTQLGSGSIGMFQLAPMGLVLLVVGILYMVLFGRKLLPADPTQTDAKERYGMGGYLTEVELLPGTRFVGKRIMDSALVRELEMDIIEIVRGEKRFVLPPGDMVLEAGDMLKVRCDVERIKALKDRANISVKTAMHLAGDDLRARGTTLVELVITAASPLNGVSLREADMIRTYRAVPLAVRHREDVVHERLHDTVLRSGDVVLAEVKSHYLTTLKEMERSPDAPFAILAEQEGIAEFDRKRFFIGVAVVLGVVLVSSLTTVPVVLAALVGVILVALTGCLTMKEFYESIDWKVIFLMAGAFSLGHGMHKSGLDALIAGKAVSVLQPFGPVAVLAGVYFITMMLTEMVSNTATAALVTPIAIGIAQQIGASPTPFIMAVCFAASASFMTPIGYQTNAMVYTAGQYKYIDFMRVGLPLSLIFFVLAVALIPLIYPF
ncbi:MAG: SLC13 family permease [Flavobacteriales bacterium]|nr:SLC13 family permease [Flavobacteriales bacterium]